MFFFLYFLLLKSEKRGDGIKKKRIENVSDCYPIECAIRLKSLI